MDLAFADSLRELLSALASGAEPAMPAGGGLGRVLRETGATTPRNAVELLVDRWFRAPPPHLKHDSNDLLLNRTELGDRPLPSNRPLPEYVRFIGRQHEVATLLRWLGEPGGTVVGVEGPGGSGKTALLHAVADACEAATRCWYAVVDDTEHPLPLFDAFVW